MSSTRNNSIIGKCYRKKRKKNIPYYFWCFSDIKTPQKQPRTRVEIYKLRLSQVSEKKNGPNQNQAQDNFHKAPCKNRSAKCIDDSTKLMSQNKKKKSSRIGLPLQLATLLLHLNFGYSEIDSYSFLKTCST